MAAFLTAGLMLVAFLTAAKVFYIPIHLSLTLDSPGLGSRIPSVLFSITPAQYTSGIHDWHRYPPVEVSLNFVMRVFSQPQHLVFFMSSLDRINMLDFLRFIFAVKI